MAAVSEHATLEQHFESLTTASPNMHIIDELRQAKREIELLKTMDPFRAAEMAIEIQVERMRVDEATNARDAVVQRLADAYISIRQKNAAIEILQRESDALRGTPEIPKPSLTSNVGEGSKEVDEEIVRLEGVVMTLGDEVKLLKESAVGKHEGKYVGDPPPRYEMEKIEISQSDFGREAAHPSALRLRTETSRIPFRVLAENAAGLQRHSPSPIHSNQFHTKAPEPRRTIIDSNNDMGHQVIETPAQPDDPDYMIKRRLAILAALPLPSDIPDDDLKPILIPVPFTLHEFLGNASGSLRNSLANYRVFQQLTTSWCPEREEHGYMLTPIFKCSTNPRVATAHRWSAVDVIGKMSRATECFYNKDGKWYYAGVYQAFKLEDLTTREWEALSIETSQALVKETISGRKNTSPQNLYETAQLYGAGALKVACVGLQCVGFNNTMYRAILEQAKKCEMSGKWRSGDSPVLGWSAGAREVGVVEEPPEGSARFALEGGVSLKPWGE